MHEATESTLRTELENRRTRLRSTIPAHRSRRLQGLLQEVDSALARLDSGAFGICEHCHDPVEADRLLADPLVRVCLDCLTPGEQRALEHDLELAGRIQSALLPSTSLTHAGWDAHYVYQPLGAVSGDFCDLVPTATGNEMLFLFGDVSGKGVSASILMAQLQAAFRSLVTLRLPLVEMLGRVNHLFCSHSPASSFATLVCGRLSPSGDLEICNAGHCAPLVRHDGRVTAFETSGLPLGLFCEGEFTVRELRLLPGDLLVLYTDGISEAHNAAGESYDVDRIRSIVAQGNGWTPEQINAACIRDLDAFRLGSPRDDDLTLMTIRRTPGQSRRNRLE